ncbi:MAG: hypothetical protein ACHQ01_05020 [Candidatus Limnocylindrales bacterium]
MRSCLIQLLLTVAVIFALLWFGLPFGASWLATNALNAAGFTGTDTKVEVSADLPPRILLGHADKVHLTSTQVSVGGLNAATFDVTLGDVSLFDRTVGTVSGTLTGVRVPAPDGEPVTIATATLAGAGTAVRSTLTISTAEAQGLAQTQLKAQTGLVGTVKFAAPNAVTVTVRGTSQQAHLVVAAGGTLELVPVSTALQTVTLLETGNGNPFQLSSVTVGAGGVTLVGTIDIQTLLGL